MEDEDGILRDGPYKTLISGVCKVTSEHLDIHGINLEALQTS
jgi:hypothetical protein